MNTTIMTARVTDQRMLLVNEPLVASGGVDVLQIRFEFCGLWDGCGKVAVFYRDQETVYHVPIVDGLATVPNELLTEAGCFYFGVMGSSSNIRTTEVLRVKVVKGPPTEATANHEELTPDIYQQILAAYGKLDSGLATERARIDAMLLEAYPVGAIYMSVEATDPARLFGGTWQRLKDRFLLGAGDTYEAGETGGDAVHTLTVDEMPVHHHQGMILHDTSLDPPQPVNFDVVNSGVPGDYVQGNIGFTKGEDYKNLQTRDAGGGQPHNNMPPYLAVYMWVRIA